jgi:hypothetical protein
MSSEVYSTLLQVVAPVLAGVVIFLIGRWYEKRDKGRKKIIETNITKTQLVNPEKLGPISMYVDASFLMGNEPAEGVALAAVKSAYSYTIEVANKGLEDIDGPEINITLDSNAIIVEMKVNSETIPKDKIEERKDEKNRNFRRIVPQYLNRNDILSISVLSINNSSSNCKVLIGGLGIIHQERNPRKDGRLSNSEVTALAQILIAFIGVTSTIVVAYLAYMASRP